MPPVVGFWVCDLLVVLFCWGVWDCTGGMSVQPVVGRFVIWLAMVRNLVADLRMVSLTARVSSVADVVSISASSALGDVSRAMSLLRTCERRWTALVNCVKNGASRNSTSCW